jgi:hypothetical protein
MQCIIDVLGHRRLAICKHSGDKSERYSGDKGERSMCGMRHRLPNAKWFEYLEGGDAPAPASGATSYNNSQDSAFSRAFSLFLPFSRAFEWYAKGATISITNAAGGGAACRGAVLDAFPEKRKQLCKLQNVIVTQIM